MRIGLLLHTEIRRPFPENLLGVLGKQETKCMDEKRKKKERRSLEAKT